MISSTIDCFNHTHLLTGYSFTDRLISYLSLQAFFTMNMDTMQLETSRLSPTFGCRYIENIASKVADLPRWGVTWWGQNGGSDPLMKQDPDFPKGLDDIVNLASTIGDDADKWLDHLTLYGSHRVWENKEDVMDFLLFCGFIPSFDEIKAIDEWCAFTKMMKFSSEWHDVDSTFLPSLQVPGFGDVPADIREELSWQEVAEDAEEWLEEMFRHRLSALDEKDPISYDNPDRAYLSWMDVDESGSEEMDVDESVTESRPLSSLECVHSPGLINASLNLNTSGYPCSFASIAPLEPKWVKCHIQETVYNDKSKHLRHFIGKWDGGEIFFTKTLGSQIVKAQQKLHRDYEGRANDPMFPPDSCGDFESFRVSQDPDKYFYVNLIQSPVGEAFPWRAKWIHSYPK